MSTISKERAQEIFLGNGPEPTASEERELARIALASLEAEPVCVIDQANLDYLKSDSDADVWPASRIEMGDVLLYRSAPPVPVSVPDAMEMDDDFDSSFEHGKAVGWNAYRAAMLQGAEPVTTAYKLPTESAREKALAIQLLSVIKDLGLPENVPFVDVLNEVYRLQSNSPVIPDGWVACSERTPEQGEYVSAISRHGEYVSGQVIDDWLELHDGTSFSVEELYLWMPLPALPAAPQQEA
ncbi:hypothetical protein ASU86_25500 [Enterobacter hormaechei subsp. steigerwaltii]|uniref:DUF551 domain-containing protein n=1 Tax=Enterobacter hormaechei TaxID=158836 RepID=UPI00073509C3|nr:DUF551 domain-containing protein [Enterobacter hormaechei]KTJ24536.1 hypothetical protein ASU86_25500 [Enterobacter hormaechei subsp. steigerwaltii]